MSGSSPHGSGAHGSGASLPIPGPVPVVDPSKLSVVFAETRIIAVPGSVIQIDARKSFTTDATPREYRWSFVQAPIGSAYEIHVQYGRLPGTVTWNGTTTVLMTDTSQIQGTQIRLDRDDQWFEVISVTPGVSVQISNPLVLVIPTSSAGETSSHDGPNINPMNDSFTDAQSIIDLRSGDLSAISFIPDKLGTYIIHLDGVDGGKSVLTEIGLSRALCGSGTVPDAKFLWSFLSNFWTVVEDREYFQVLWSAAIQLIGADAIKLWSNDYNKSLSTIQPTVQRRWQRFNLTTTLIDSVQRVIVGNTLDGNTGVTGEIGALGTGSTSLMHVLLSENDFTRIDVNYGAKGRVIDVGGHGYTIKRVSTQVVSAVSYSLLETDESDIPDSLSGVEYRIPHLLHVPYTDLEEAGVRKGDVIVFEVRRRDTGQTAEIRAQVVTVDRERVGFEFTLADLAIGDPTLDHELFHQLALDLRLVSPAASDVEIAAAGEALISFIPTGVNLSSSPFTAFQITVRAKSIWHNSAINIDDLLVSVPFLQQELIESPDLIFRENFDYQLISGYLEFSQGLFSPQNPAPEYLWAETVHVDNTPTIERNFGIMVDLKKDDLTAKATRAPYLSAVKGLWFALTNGPTVANIRLGLQILMGLPFTEEHSLIIAITENFSKDTSGNDIGRILLEDVDDRGQRSGFRRIALYPQIIGLDDNPQTGVPYVAGDLVEKFVPLSRGVTVTDYVKDARWWLVTLQNREILKFFNFKAEIDTDSGVFNTSDFIFAINFIRKIKPSYTNVIATALKNLADDDIMAAFQEGISGSSIRGNFFDNIGSWGGHESTVRGDDLNHQGAILWRGDSRPFSTRTTPLLTDITTAPNGSAVEATSGGSFGSLYRARVLGDSTHPTVEGDLLFIQQGEAGAFPLTPRLLEITSGTGASGPLVLGNDASGQEPQTWDVNAPDSALFRYGADIRGEILRRALNPVVQGSDLSTAGTDVVTSASSLFVSDGVAVDDHLIIESGPNVGEYRIVSMVVQPVFPTKRDYTPSGVVQISQTQLRLVGLDGVPSSPGAASGQDFRVIRPSFMRTRIERCKVVDSGGQAYIDVLDFDGGAPTIPFDTFTPGMVSRVLLNVQNSANPANNGDYPALAYVHAGRMRISAGAPSGGTDASATATVTIKPLNRVNLFYWPGFERAEELAPTEVFSAVVV